MQIIGHRARCFTESDTPQTRPILRLADTITYIEQNISSRVRIEELVEVSGMSESTLLRAFKRTTVLGYEIP